MTTTKPLALITGAAAGIGAEYARQFAAKGYDLILVDRDEARQRQVADEIKAQHDCNCSVIAADLGTDAGPQTLFETVQQQGAPVDVLVNNAGILHRGPFAQTALADHRALVMVNCMACMTLAHLFLQPMLARGAGRILNTVSLSGFQPVSMLANYAASKAYMLSLTEALHMETRGTGVTVTAICPGFANTNMVLREHESTPMHLPLVKNLEPADVARQGYAACMAGKPVHIVGRLNWLVNLLTRLQPGWLRRWVMLRLSQRDF